MALLLRCNGIVVYIHFSHFPSVSCDHILVQTWMFCIGSKSYNKWPRDSQGLILDRSFLYFSPDSCSSLDVSWTSLQTISEVESYYFLKTFTETEKAWIHKTISSLPGEEKRNQEYLFPLISLLLRSQSCLNMAYWGDRV